MEKPREFYTTQVEELKNQVLTTKKQLLRLSLFRFLVFLISIAFLVFWVKGNTVLGVIGLLLLGGFVFLVLKHQNKQREKKIAEAKLSLNQTELKVLDKDFKALPTGDEFLNPQHFFSHDIDLFGRSSFFQYLNRTATKAGKQLLADTLTSNNTENITKKQEALQDLAPKVKWRQHFSALATTLQNDKEVNTVAKELKNYTPQLPSFASILTMAFSIISIAIFTAVCFGVISFSILIVWFFVGLFISGAFFKKTNELYNKAGKSKSIFNQYHQLIAEIEEEKFTSEILVTKQKETQTNTQKASAILKDFSKILDAFDQRNNVVIAVFGNAFFLWEIRNALKTEKWIAKHKNTVEKWFDVVAFFDAQNSLANFVYNHPNYVFPVLQEEKSIITGEKLGHPLLKEAKRIDNDFNIDKEEFFIVTGANMAGKSTFLRTVSLSIVMANCGLPVCASDFKYSPTKLITSMRTTDSLSEDESYFYSELKRLKFIVDEIKDENYFIILDEILKGTNSTDKAEGSKKFVEKLTKSKSTGIIATHDVSLCELANEYQEVKNYFFDAYIADNELTFDYLLKEGICKYRNASFLLQKMEIV